MNKKTKALFANSVSPFLVFVSFAFLMFVPFNVSASDSFTPEEIIEKLSTDRNDLNPYVDRMFFSDTFKSEVIQKEYNMTAGEFDQCIRLTAQSYLYDPMNRIEDPSYEVIYTNKKVIDDKRERLEYDIKSSFLLDEESYTEETHDFSYFIKRDGEWFVDLMPEYLEKKNTEEPLNLCDVDQIIRKRKAELAGFILAKNAPLLLNYMTVLNNGEAISVSDTDGQIRFELMRNGKEYEISLPAPLQKGKALFVSDSYDWNPIKENIAIAQKIADIFAASQINYTTEFGEYSFDLTLRTPEIWNTKAYREIDLKAENYEDQGKEVYLIIDTKQGTISEDQQQQKIIDKEKQDFKDSLSSRNKNEYKTSIAKASIETLALLLITIIAGFFIKILSGMSFKFPLVFLSVMLAALTWFINGLITSPYMLVSIVSKLPLTWPFGFLLGAIYSIIIFNLFSILIVDLIMYLFLRKSELSRKLAIVSIIVFSLIQYAIFTLF